MSEYVLPQWLIIESKHMTLNSHFALNTAFQVELFSVDSLILRHDCFTRLRAVSW